MHNLFIAQNKHRKTNNNNDNNTVQNYNLISGFGLVFTFCELEKKCLMQQLYQLYMHDTKLIPNQQPRQQRKIANKNVKNSEKMIGKNPKKTVATRHPTHSKITLKSKNIPS